jgi:hypothetical protein
MSDSEERSLDEVRKIIPQPVEAEEVKNELVLAHTGELVDLTSEREIVKAYQEVDDLVKKLQEATRVLRFAMKERASVLGTKTIHIDGIGKVELTNTRRVHYPDPLALADALRAAGCPEETISEIVLETVSHNVDGARAKRAAQANETYAEIIERHQQVVEPLPSIRIT